VNLTAIAGIVFVVLAAVLMLVFSLVKRKAPPVFRDIPAFSRLRRAIGLAVEDGTRLHFSFGHSSLIVPRSASAFAALAGDAALTILAQDTLHSAYRSAAAEGLYDPNAARLTGLTPFSYAAGAIPIMRDEDVSANILMGNFGVEVAFLTDTSERETSFTMAATDSLPAQAIIYATAQEPLIGEELYAAGAYVDAGPSHTASLQVQDILRWLIVAAVLSGVMLKLLGF
jgi:hypothetical protein